MQLTIDRSPIRNVVRPLIFSREDWPMVGEGRKAQIQGLPGTWFKLPENSPLKGALTLICCPGCKKISILLKKDRKIDVFGKVSPSFKCASKECSFHHTIYLDKWHDGKTLYAIATIERGKIEFTYCHATNDTEARFHLGAGRYKIIGIAPAIGLWANDRNGRDLSV